MSRTLIVSDIHEDWLYVQQAEALASEADAVVTLGDYWDSWNGVTEATHQITSWVKKKMYDPKWTMLWGNHDVHYAFPMPQLRSSGYSTVRQRIIARSFEMDDWGRLHFQTWVEGWLLTHAGLAPQTLPRAMTAGEVAEYCRQTEADVKQWLASGDPKHPWLQAGFSRGGMAVVGGVVWADWMDVGVIPGVNQLFGHTEAFAIRKKAKNGFEAICMDTQRRHVGWLEDGQLTFQQVKP